MLTMTDKARDKFKELLADHPGKHLRVIFEGFGWGGPKLGLALDELKKDEQIVLINEIELIIDASVLPYAKGNEIDYISNPYGQGFSIAPTTRRSC